MRRLDWQIILTLSVFGPVMGAVTVAGLVQGRIADLLWGVYTVACGIVLFRRRVDNIFAHGAVTGFIAGASATFIQALFAATFVANNPAVLEKYSNMPGSDRQYFFFMLAPFIGIASALLGGLIAFFIERANRESNP